MPAQNIIDGLITFRIIKMLVTPWTDTPAYKLGIISADGTPLKTSDELKSPQEKAAYTVLWRLVFKLKRILGKIPLVNKNLTNYAAALWLVKENSNLETDNLDESFIVEDYYNEILNSDLSEEIAMLKSYAQLHPSFELVQIILREEAPANNVGGGQIAGMDPSSVGRLGKKAPRLRRFGEFKKKKD